jgi:hypothetical protein
MLAQLVTAVREWSFSHNFLTGGRNVGLRSPAVVLHLRRASASPQQADHRRVKLFVSSVPQADVTPLQKKWSPIYSTNSSLMSWTPAR